ncbi:MAG: hypothetical protein MI747_18850, partial [Desulfobacterales bacterium]|nr:hypothetical protein [Desulfobacterales bacterium]
MTLDPKPRWTAEKANEWYQAQPWMVGCNYLPRTAVNFVDMWHPDTFSEAVIDEELGWAAALGMNILRVNLQFLLWQEKGTAHKDSFDRFLDVCERHAIRVMPCLFDDCAFGGAPANSARQPDPVPGVHNSRALASPGREIVADPARRDDLLNYVHEVIDTYRADRRIAIWDLYNEPGNGSVFQSDKSEVESG